MKTIVCEMCGNNNLIKQEGNYVCQSCGTKYTLEEAKNLLVDVGENDSNVSVDKSNQVSKYIELSEIAMKAGNLKEAIEYANKALEIDSTNYYVYYLKGLSISYQTSIAMPKFEEGIKYMLVGVDYVTEDKKTDLQELISTSAYKIFSNHLGLLCENYGKDLGVSSTDLLNCVDEIYAMIDVLDEKGCQIDMKEFNKSIGQRLTSAGITYWYECFYPTTKKSRNIFYSENIRALIGEYGGVCSLLNKAISISEDKALRVRCYENLINMSEEFISLAVRQPDSDIGYYTKSVLPKEGKKLIREQITNWHKDWNAIDSNHQIPTPSKSGCYVATCVYGSYDCPQVWTLRRYRDNTLGTTWYGRVFIKLYYAISPTLVKWFGHTKWFKKMWKGKLDRMVKKLNDQGVEDSPYYDNYL